MKSKPNIMCHTTFSQKCKKVKDNHNEKEYVLCVYLLKASTSQMTKELKPFPYKQEFRIILQNSYIVLYDCSTIY